MNQKNSLFNSGINILGSIPDYATMIRYANDSLVGHPDADFSFRTENSGRRFIAAVNTEILTFRNTTHKKIFQEALASESLRLDQKLLLVFWQLTINNRLFACITENYFMRNVYAGRLTILPDEIVSYLYDLRREHPQELQWSDATLKIVGSKYPTLLKKLRLAEGSHTKEIRYPVIGDELFVILVRLALCVYPDVPTEENPLFRYSFLDTSSLISRLKSIKFTPYWTLTQIGNNIKITLNTDE